MHLITNNADHAPFVGIASLMQKVMSGVELSRLINIAACDSNDANKLMGLSIIFQLTGNREMGLELQEKALNIQQMYHIPSTSGQNGIKLLALMKPGDMMDNTPVDFLLEGSDVALDILYLSLALPFPAALPEHDVLIVAIGESDENQALLEQVGRLINSSSRYTLNKPNRIACLSRDSVSRILKSAAGIVIPTTARIDREGLMAIACGEKLITNILKDGDFPIIVRPLGSHGGEGLVKIDTPAEISEYLHLMRQNIFNIARFIDYRGSDGFYRKCRIALIDGQPFACHLAISENWIIHYKNAGMLESAAKRAEEANFMALFDEEFSHRHQEAFRILAERIGMEYLVIDCGETNEGDLLIFEVDNLGFIHALDSPEVFPYKQAQMRKVFSAFYTMLKKKKELGATCILS
jgi:glutathione synthase/RimK-type ligase-like ATP-grasp enzyme